MTENLELNRKLRVAVVQMDCVKYEKETNLQKAMEWIDEAEKQGAQLVLLPELFTTGYLTPSKDTELAETLPGPTTERLLSIYQKKGIYLGGCILERARTRIYDTAFLLGPEGYVGKYRKVHLWKGESARFTRGNVIQPFETALGCVGLLICHDVRFPEAVRTLSLQGAQIVLFPSAFGKARLYSWDIQTRARSMENGIFTLFADRVGEENGLVFAGHSRIVDPWGRVLCEVTEAEGIAVADLDFSWIQKAREEVPQLQQVAPRAYRYLSTARTRETRAFKA